MTTISTINRLNDVFFKSLMGDDSRKELTLSFLNAVMQEGQTNKFTDVEFKDQELEPTMEDGKSPRLDIVATLNDGTMVDIEVQVSTQKFMPKRSLFYWSRMYSNQAIKGDDYINLKRAVTINLLKFNLLPEEKWHNRCFITVEDSNRRLTDDLEMHFLELPKLKLKDLHSLRKLEAWGAYFYGQCTDTEMEEVIMAEPVIKKALKYENYFINDSRMRRLYDMREDGVRDYVSGINEAKRIGLAEGKAKGKAEERMSNAKSLLANNVPLDIIVKSLHLTDEEIGVLKTK